MVMSPAGHIGNLRIRIPQPTVLFSAGRIECTVFQSAGTVALFFLREPVIESARADVEKRCRLGYIPQRLVTT